MNLYRPNLADELRLGPSWRLLLVLSVWRDLELLQQLLRDFRLLAAAGVAVGRIPPGLWTGIALLLPTLQAVLDLVVLVLLFLICGHGPDCGILVSELVWLLLLLLLMLRKQFLA